MSSGRSKRAFLRVFSNEYVCLRSLLFLLCHSVRPRDWPGRSDVPAQLQRNQVVVLGSVERTHIAVGGRRGDFFSFSWGAPAGQMLAVYPGEQIVEAILIRVTCRWNAPGMPNEDQGSGYEPE